MNGVVKLSPESVLDDNSTDGCRYGRLMASDISRVVLICTSQAKGLRPAELASSFNIIIQAASDNEAIGGVKLVMGLTPRWLPKYQKTEAEVVVENLCRQGLIRSPKIEALSGLECAKGVVFDYDSLAQFSARRMNAMF